MRMACPFEPTRGRAGRANDRVFREYLAPALAKIGRDDMRVHDLRHFAGTQVARVGSLVETMSHFGALHRLGLAALSTHGEWPGRRDRRGAEQVGRVSQWRSKSTFGLITLSAIPSMEFGRSA